VVYSILSPLTLRVLIPPDLAFQDPPISSLTPKRMIIAAKKILASGKDTPKLLKTSEIPQSTNKIPQKRFPKNNPIFISCSLVY